MTNPSAEAILPIVFTEYGLDAPTVIDVGCGDGSWLKTAEGLGASQIWGVDITPPPLLTQDQFSTIDLRDLTMQTGWSEAPYDLAICVEVAEHVDEVHADQLIKLLTDLSPLVLFSAAPPGQGPVGPGPSLHCNEQFSWYWEAKFEALGYHLRDTIRPLIWTDQEIPWWYRQSVVTYTRDWPGWKDELTLISRTILRKMVS